MSDKAPGSSAVSKTADPEPRPSVPAACLPGASDAASAGCTATRDPRAQRLVVSNPYRKGSSGEESAGGLSGGDHQVEDYQVGNHYVTDHQVGNH